LSPNGDNARMSSLADSMRSLRPAEVGRTIRDRRRALGLDQASLAKRVGVSRQWIVEVERGKERAEIGLVLRTLAALGLEVTISPRAPRRKTPPRAFVPGMVDLDAIVDRARGGK